MNFKQLAAQFGEMSARGPVDIEFTAGAHDLESYPEPKMRATLLFVKDDHHDDDVMKIRVSYKKFDEYNKAFESHNYWGRIALGQDERSASYTARETGWYEVEEDLYVMATDDISKVLTILDNGPNKLYEAYQADPKGLSYVQWLESLVQEHVVSNK